MLQKLDVLLYRVPGDEEIFAQGVGDYIGLNVYCREYATDWRGGATQVSANNKGGASKKLEGKVIAPLYQTCLLYTSGSSACPPVWPSWRCDTVVPQWRVRSNWGRARFCIEGDGRTGNGNGGRRRRSRRAGLAHIDASANLRRLALYG